MSRGSRPVLTTTSFALLAQLALRPWSAYELAVQQERYFRFFWPRASRALYNELKRLAELGFATSDTSFVGRRSRTTYTLTEHGRVELRAWLDTPLSPLSLEFEGLLRILTAPLGTRDQLLANLERIRVDVAAMTALNDGIIAEYGRGVAPFQHQAHVRTLVVDFFTQFLGLTEEWIERTIAEVEGWSDVTAPGARLHALERIHLHRYGTPATATGAGDEVR